MTVVRQFPETDAADGEFSQIGVRSSADFTSVVSPRGKLGRSLLFKLHRFFSHPS
jgi:hypothetical protein